MLGLALLAFLGAMGVAHAASGTVSVVDKYAWSSVGGWVNFHPTEGGVEVTDTGLSGYAWSENDGWINLAPTNGGVENNGEGVLSGFAWDETAGWIDFAGVTIDSTGTFHGEATGANNTINFDCANCDVATTWRPGSSGSVSGVSGSGPSLLGGILRNLATPPPAGSSSTETPPGPPGVPTAVVHGVATAAPVRKPPSFLPSWLTGSNAYDGSPALGTSAPPKATRSLFPLSSSVVWVAAVVGGVAIAAAIILVLFFFF